MELVLINGEACVKKHITNEKVYRTLASSGIAGIPEILKIESNVIYYKYVNGETLKNRLENDNDISNEFIRFLVFSCTTIACSLHNYNIVHNDLTPDNIIITPKGKIYIIDFESATFDGHQVDSEVEMTSFSSPEILSNSATTFQSDIYSLGKILELIDTQKLFQKVTDKCTEQNPKNRYTSFRAMLHEVNAIYSMIKDDEVIEFNWVEYYNKRFLIMIAATALVGGGAGYYLSSFTENSNVVRYIVFSIYAALAVLDVCDYLRVVMFEGKRLRKILSFKLIFSVMLFFVTVLISLILM